jgi:hypothetical protein
MYLSKKHLSRRTVLRGLGAAVSLPLLDAMVPAGTALAQTAAAPTLKMGFIYFPHGAVMDRWTPVKDGPDFDTPYLIEPLAPFRDQLTIVSGTENKPGVSAAVHGIMPGTWLSAVHPKKQHEPFGGVTIDQIAAQHLGQDTAFPSLELAVEGRSGSGACDGVYGCGFGDTVSFRTPTTPLPMENNPRKLFQRLFGRGDTPEERKILAAQQISLLDMIQEQTAALNMQLGAPDRVALDGFLENVREIERRVQALEERDLSHLNLPEAPIGVLDDFDGQINLIFDIAALSYQAGLTRVFSMMMAGEATNQTYTHIGIADGFHPISHHQNDPVRMERLAQIQRYNSETFAKFVQKLKDMPDGDGSMLDHSILLFGSNMSNSNMHNNFPLPSAILGGGCGAIKGNQHLRYADRTPHANLLYTLMMRAGVPVDAVGDSTGEFSEI